MKILDWFKDKLSLPVSDNKDKYRFFEVEITGFGYMGNSFHYNTITLYSTSLMLEKSVQEYIYNKRRHGKLNFPRFNWKEVSVILLKWETK